MKPQDFARMSTELRLMASSVSNPERGDPYANALLLACYHLNAAAVQLRDIAEMIVQKEQANAAAK